ncbi:MAG TPA: DNA N-6-adenine-methyltransferase [Burkholderiales bacterium]|nr:DNA N-6-adenine-methyltransferase [Burkholderiales bacterium]
MDDRRTPETLFAELHLEHAFTVDAAASVDNAKLPRFFDLARNGLAQSWRGEKVWCNPPYSDLFAWTYKALAEVAWGGCLKVVMILPANRTEQRWWQDLIEPIRDRGLGVSTRYIRGRVKFHGPLGRITSKKGAGSVPFGSVLLIIERPSTPPSSNLKEPNR